MHGTALNKYWNHLHREQFLFGYWPPITLTKYDEQDMLGIPEENGRIRK